MDQNNMYPYIYKCISMQYSSSAKLIRHVYNINISSLWDIIIFMVFRCSTLDFNEVLALERFQIHHKYHFSPKHLPVTPSNLLKSETDQNDWNDEEKDNFDHKYETEDEGSSKRSQSTDEGMLSTIENEQPPNYSQVKTNLFLSKKEIMQNTCNFPAIST